MRRPATIIGLIALLIVSTFAVSFAQTPPATGTGEEKITITTYYPSPMGVYKKVQIFPSTPCEPNGPSDTTCNQAARGTLYYCNNTMDVMICDCNPDDPTKCKWKPAFGWGDDVYWKSVNDVDIFNKNYTGNVGIGTFHPDAVIPDKYVADTVWAKLHVNGGIKIGYDTGDAQGTYAGNVSYCRSEKAGTVRWNDRVSPAVLERCDGTMWSQIAGEGSAYYVFDKNCSAYSESGYSVCHRLGKCCAGIGEPSGVMGVGSCWGKRLCGAGHFWGGYSAKHPKKCKASATYTPYKAATCCDSSGNNLTSEVPESCAIGSSTSPSGASLPAGAVCLNSDGDASNDDAACHVSASKLKKMNDGQAYSGYWCYYDCFEEAKDYGYAMCYDCTGGQTTFTEFDAE